jgi:hypothetical protein
VPFIYGLDTLKAFVGRMYAIEVKPDCEDSDVIKLSVMDKVTIALHFDTPDIEEFEDGGDAEKRGTQSNAEGIETKPRPGQPRSSHVELSWRSNPFNDMIADSLICVLLSVGIFLASDTC